MGMRRLSMPLVLVAVVLCFLSIRVAGLLTPLARQAVTSRLLATVEKSAKIRVTNAFDSPSIIKFTKDPKDIKGYNPAASPSCRVNGGAKTDSTVDVTKSPSIMMLQRAGTEAVDALKSPAVKFLGIDESKVKNAMKSPSLQVTSESKVRDSPCVLPVGCTLVARLTADMHPSVQRQDRKPFFHPSSLSRYCRCHCRCCHLLDARQVSIASV